MDESADSGDRADDSLFGHLAVSIQPLISVFFSMSHFSVIDFFGRFVSFNELGVPLNGPFFKMKRDNSSYNE